MSESTTPAENDRTAQRKERAHSPLVIGDPRLHAVHDFIENTEQNATNPLAVVRRSFRGRVRLAVFLALILATLLGTVGYFAGSPLFVSHGLIRVAAREPKLLYADKNDARLRLFDAFVAGEVVYLGSRPVLEKAVVLLRKKDAAGVSVPRDAEEMAKTISINRKKGLIVVEGQAGNARSAAARVNALLDSYQQLNREQLVRRQDIRKRELLSHRDQLLVRLRKLDARTLRVGAEYGAHSIAKAHIRKIAQLEDIERRLGELQWMIAQREAAAARGDGDGGRAEIKRAMLADRAVAEMTHERIKRVAMLENLKLRYRAGHSKIRMANAELKVINRALAQRRAQIAKVAELGILTVMDGKDSVKSIIELRSLRENLTGRAQNLRAEARGLNAKQDELAFIGEERRAVRSLLDEAGRVLEQVAFEEKNRGPGIIEIKAWGGIPIRPADDKRKEFAAVGALMGAGVAFAIVFLMAFIRPKCRFSDDLDAFTSSNSPAIVLPNVDAMEASQFSEAIHRLRNELLLSANDECMVVAITGAEVGVGISSVSNALARSFAVARFRTVVLDGDIETHALSSEFGHDDSPGFHELVDGADPDTCSHECAGMTFSIVPTGDQSDAGDAELSGPRVSAAIDRLKSKFEVVVIDADAVDQRLAAQLFAAAADRVVLVVKSGVSTQSVLRATQTIARVSTGPVCIAFNRARPGDPGLRRPDAAAA